MGILLAITLGIREQNTVQSGSSNARTCGLSNNLLTLWVCVCVRAQLACLFMLLWTCQFLGLLNELYSRPVIQADRANYSYPMGRLGFVEKPDYTKNPNALHLLSGSHWEGDRPLRDDQGKPVVNTNFDYLHAQRVSNFMRRQVPYFLGWFPFMTYVIVVVYHLEYQKYMLNEETAGDLTIPSWVNAALYGTIMLFASFAVVMPVFQYLPPSFYWGSEIMYCILSLTAKLWLGSLIMVNVIMQEGRADDVLGASALQRR